MDTRRAKNLKKPSDHEEDNRSQKKSTKKMQRYRSNVKADPVRLEQMRMKDRDRKLKKREEQRLVIQKGNKQLDKKLKQQRNQHMTKYRNKRKKAKRTETSAQTDDATKDEDRRIKHIESTKKWRMKVKLLTPKDKTESEPSIASCSKSTIIIGKGIKKK